jgi:hypothetical protein
MYDHALGAEGHWAALGAFGANDESGEAFAASGLVEANVDLDGRNVLFGRVEVVQKPGDDLVLPSLVSGSRYLLTAFNAGYLRNLPHLGPFLPGVGARGTLNLVPGALDYFYGSRTPFGLVAYLRLAIAPMSHEHMHHMSGMDMPDMDMH